MLISTLYCLVRWHDIAHEAGQGGSIMLEPKHTKELEEVRLGGLSGFKWLSKHAAENKLYRYNIIPKLHSLDHALRRAIRTGVSFAAWWTYNQEDFMGMCAKLTSKIHPAAICVRSIDRWLSGFKAGFSDASDPDSDVDELSASVRGSDGRIERRRCAKLSLLFFTVLCPCSAIQFFN